MIDMHEKHLLVCVCIFYIMHIAETTLDTNFHE